MRYLAVVLLFLSQCTLAEPAGWAKTSSLMATDTGYKMNYEYQGDEGRFLFHYVVVGDGAKILTEVLDGSARGAGTRIYYEPARDPDNVFMDTKFLTLRRSLTARDIKDTSLYQPLFRQLLGKLTVPEPTEVKKMGEKTLFLFGEPTESQDRIIVDRDGKPLSYRRLENGREIKKMTFQSLEFGPQSIQWED